MQADYLLGKFKINVIYLLGKFKRLTFESHKLIRYVL